MGDSNARNMQSSCQIEINSVTCVSGWDYMEQEIRVCLPQYELLNHRKNIFKEDFFWKTRDLALLEIFFFISSLPKKTIVKG